MAYMKLQDCTLYYELHGKGEPLLLLHGNGEDHRYFCHQITYFSQHYQVIVVDMRGHGQSEMGLTPLSFALFADDVKALLTYLHIAKVHILGFSDGGNTAMVFSLSYPEYVETLILNGANYHPNGMKCHVQLSIVFTYKLLSLCTMWITAWKDKQQIMGLMVHQPDITIAQLEMIRARTLVLVGEHDMVKESHSRNIAEVIPHAIFMKIRGNHFIANKEWQTFNPLVLKFLNNSLSNKKDA